MKPLIIRRSWDLLSSHFPRLTCDIDFRRRNKNFEPDLWLVPQFCDGNSRSIDVGANQGIYSRWMCRHSANVESFECNPYLLEPLRSFLPKKAQIHPVALSDRQCDLPLRFNPDNTGIGTVESRNVLGGPENPESFQTIEVPCKRLDDYQFCDVSFLKIDVEGHEHSVLSGAKELLGSQKPAILIEIEERHCPGNLEKVPSFLQTFGYRPHFLDPASNSLREISDLATSAAQGQINFWFLSR